MVGSLPVKYLELHILQQEMATHPASVLFLASCVTKCQPLGLALLQSACVSSLVALSRDLEGLSALLQACDELSRAFIRASVSIARLGSCPQGRVG